MTSFDHRAEGTAEVAWLGADLGRLPSVSAMSGRLLLLAAHPDDETLGAGGLLATAARAGAEIVVVIATDGEASHPASPTHSPTRLAAMRRKEVHSAIGHLAPQAQIHCLGLPDGRVSEYADRLDAALAAIVGNAPGCVVT